MLEYIQYCFLVLKINILLKKQNQKLITDITKMDQFKFRILISYFQYKKIKYDIINNNNLDILILSNKITIPKPNEYKLVKNNAKNFFYNKKIIDNLDNVISLSEFKTKHKTKI